ncbi:hypothetical protein EHP00_630 [Ecytonucleospora hepatopenaei]|uniref:PRA1 family protein n=1 Tax=Ecytonucleospora hepatopenaei TaxID=646526 RepID=A0A1W0E2K6_9MICR|nr:hypothetical protein EHP00_630 [Ecytonucleospora hepatopenaei]
METGGFGTEENGNAVTTLDYIKNKYYEKPTFSEFVEFKKPTDYSLDGIMENTKKGVDKFGVYYVAFGLLLYILFILSSPMFVIPISTVCFTIYLMQTKTQVYGQEITPQQAIIGCCGINAILFIIFRSYFVSRLVYFFAINALVVFFAVIHSQCSKTLEAEEEEKL